METSTLLAVLCCAVVLIVGLLLKRIIPFPDFVARFSDDGQLIPESLFKVSVM